MAMSSTGRKIAWKGYANRRQAFVCKRQRKQMIQMRAKHDYCCRFLTFCDSHCKPSKSPSPVVAQLETNVNSNRESVKQTSANLGCTYHDLSRILCKPSFSVTSAGDIAMKSCKLLSRMGHPLNIHTYLREDPACSQRQAAGIPSFPYHLRYDAVPASLRRSALGLGCQPRRRVLGFLCSNVSRAALSYLGHRHPTH